MAFALLRHAGDGELTVIFRRENAGDKGAAALVRSLSGTPYPIGMTGPRQTRTPDVAGTCPSHDRVRLHETPAGDTEMNRIYRTLWNAALGRMVVASELARAPSGRARVALLASVALALPMTAMAQATAVGLQTFEAPAAVDATDVARYFQASGSADSDAGA